MRDARCPGAMRLVVFCHSIASDYNNDDAHFFRGVVNDFAARGHEVAVFEPADGASMMQLLRDQGVDPIHRLAEHYPGLDSTPFDLDRLDLDEALEAADVVLVHEHNAPQLVQKIGAHHAKNRHYSLFFHDTHHPPIGELERDLRDYDAALVSGEKMRDLYLRYGWAKKVFVWRDAVDTRIFRPLPPEGPQHDLLWYGRAELDPLLLEPVRALALDAHAYGARYRDEEISALAAAGLKYEGWAPNYALPRLLAQHKVAVHLPPRRARPNERDRSGLRVLEALACGVPLVCGPWVANEALCDAGADFLIAQDAEDMTRKIRVLLSDRALAEHMSAKGLETVRTRHTTTHRVDELLAVHRRVLAEKRHRALELPPLRAAIEVHA